MGRSCIDVRCVGEPSVIASGLKSMREVIIKRTGISVRNVGKHFLLLHPCKHIKGFTQEKHLTNVRNVGKPSCGRQDFGDT